MIGLQKRRKILGESSKVKNHNGGEKSSLKELFHKKLKDLQIILSKIVASLKDEGYRPMLEPFPKDEAGKIYADFAIHRIIDNQSKKMICYLKLTNKSLNIIRTFPQAKNPSEVFPFENFLKDENRDNFKEELKILLK